MAPRRLPVLSGRKVVQTLERAGFVLRHVRGSHHVMVHAGPPQRMVSIPVHGNQEIPTGTLGAILREAGMSRDEFMALL